MLLTVLIAGALGAEPWQWSGRAGAQVDAGTRGLFELGFRRKDLTIQLYTNALDVRWEPSTQRGRGWIGLRAEPLLAGLFFSRWKDGRPDEASSVFAFAWGADAGFVTYLPDGFYVGGQLFGQVWHFLAQPGTLEVPGVQPMLRTDALLGWWHPWAHVWARAGLDMLIEGPSPHVHLTATTAFPWVVRPALTLRAGWAEGQTDIVRTRIGGLNPYEVQLAGAVWSEIWAEDYAALRVGPEVGAQVRRLTWSANVVVDLVWHDEAADLGLAGNARFVWGARWLEVGVGASPTLPRPDGVPLSAFVRIGADWTDLRRRKQ